MRSLAGAGLVAHLPVSVAEAFERAAIRWQSAGNTVRLLARDSTLWTRSDEARWTGWLDAPHQSASQLSIYRELAESVRARRFSHVLLLGMGGSSMWPEVLGSILGAAPGAPQLLVLDSTDPAQIRAFERRVTLPTTLLVVASKSGSTIEPNLLFDYFHTRLAETVGAVRAREQSLAITDPDSALERRAAGEGFWRAFLGQPSIGGRYSALSAFGLVPAAVLGLDLQRLLDCALVARAAAEAPDPGANPGVALGLMLGELAQQGRDKLTLVASPAIAGIGAWIEQLVAESLGKNGKGIVPVDAEPLGRADRYGDDRVFVHLRFSDDPRVEIDDGMRALREAGHPVIRIDIPNPYEIAAEAVRWSVATAVAGAVLGVNPFDQPDVESAKIAARSLLADFESTGRMPEDAPLAATASLRVYAKGGAGLPGDVDRAMGWLLGTLAPHGYLAVLAFIEMTPAHTAILDRIRVAVRDARKVATTLGYGPRYLHSSGQMHKGGPRGGAYIVITCDEVSDLAIPGRRVSFGAVKLAQACGDFAVLAERERPVLRVHLGANVTEGLEALKACVVRALG